ncbi:GntR family transcriptional regulator [Agrobacterium pusense]|uniref:GntR family transcriptional regulator n=1 Tax=Agrobacterium pusense TaxID=648995 RepID=UPI00244A9401|nr:GntR family transcriptional regulator [Agrobacterium pusense]MDH0872715.1 GntR family transcriptional regulator [Agrobacterium pusense]
MSDTTRLQSYLRSVAMTAAPGERVPTVRRLMQDFSLSQQNVERALKVLKEEGLIAAHVGRGTFFTGGQAAPVKESRPDGSSRTQRSVILLRRSSNNLRGRVVLEELQRRLNDAGHITLEVGYSDPEHAKQILQTLPRFDACVVQNSFDTMPIDMIAAIRRKTDTIIVDGAWLVGTDIDAVGFEWGQSVEAAIDRLLVSGHDCIHLMTTSSFFLANEMGLHRWRILKDRADLRSILQTEIRIAKLPPKDYEETAILALREALAVATPAKRRALVIWGIEDGTKFHELLRGESLAIPVDLSVILLGRTDLDPEAGGFFHVIGYSAADQANGVYDRLIERWQKPNEPFGLRLLPMTERPGPSLGGQRAPQ